MDVNLKNVNIYIKWNSALSLGYLFVPVWLPLTIKIFEMALPSQQAFIVANLYDKTIFDDDFLSCICQNRFRSPKNRSGVTFVK